MTMHDWPETKPYDSGPPALATLVGFMIFSVYYVLWGVLIGYLIWGRAGQ